MAGSLQIAGAPEMYGQIYLITNKVNGKRYVGQTTHTYTERWKQHVHKARCEPEKQRISRAIAKYGPEAFEIRLVAEAPDQEILDRFEDFYILHLDTMNPEKGYNLKRGGNQGRLAEHVKLKMSLAQKGVPKSPEHCEAISKARKGKGRKFGPENAFFGKTHSEETLAKMRGREFSDEHKKNISLSKQGEKGSKYRHDVKTEDLVAMYNSGLGTWSIAKQVGMDKVTVWARLKKAGVEIRTSGWKRSMSADSRKKISETLRAKNGG